MLLTDTNRPQAALDDVTRYAIHFASGPCPGPAAMGDARQGRVPARAGFPSRAAANRPHAPLRLTAAGSCLALMDDLAASCVLFFDIFRRPPGKKELARGRAAGLTPGQRELLERFGCPYALEENRFYLTLTGKVADTSLRDQLFRTLAPMIGALGRVPAVTRSMCVFQQPWPDGRFRMLRRFPLGWMG